MKASALDPSLNTYLYTYIYIYRYINIYIYYSGYWGSEVKQSKLAPKPWSRGPPVPQILCLCATSWVCVSRGQRTPGSSSQGCIVPMHTHTPRMDHSNSTDPPPPTHTHLHSFPCITKLSLSLRLRLLPVQFCTRQQLDACVCRRGHIYHNIWSGSVGLPSCCNSRLWTMSLHLTSALRYLWLPAELRYCCPFFFPPRISIDGTCKYTY